MIICGSGGDIEARSEKLEARKQMIENGEWKMENRSERLGARRWKIENGKWRIRSKKREEGGKKIEVFP